MIIDINEKKNKVEEKIAHRMKFYSEDCKIARYFGYVSEDLKPDVVPFYRENKVTLEVVKHFMEGDSFSFVKKNYSTHRAVMVFTPCGNTVFSRGTTMQEALWRAILKAIKHSELGQRMLSFTA